MLRFSLIGLLFGLLIISAGCAALVNPSTLWVRVVTNATVLALLISAAGAFYLPARAKVIAGGFAIFGWCYLLLLYGPTLEALRPQLMTSVALERLESISNRDGQAPKANRVDAWVRADLAERRALRTFLAGSPGTNFQQIGHSIWTVVLGCLGGVLASLFDARSRKGSKL